VERKIKAAFQTDKDEIEELLREARDKVRRFVQDHGASMDDLKHARKRLKKYFMPFFDGGTDGEAKAQERKLKRKD
jgi:hypothetical protein